MPNPVKERSPEQTAISVSLTKDQLAQIDARADSLNLPRSRYLVLVAQHDIARAHSRSAKRLAVKRVTENKGAKTPGVDNVRWRTDRQKYAAVQDLKRRGYRPLPLRRHYIPKKNGKLRPLSIPTMRCRAMQALHALALKPIAETVGDRNS